MLNQEKFAEEHSPYKVVFDYDRDDENIICAFVRSTGLKAWLHDVFGVFSSGTVMTESQLAAQTQIRWRKSSVKAIFEEARLAVIREKGRNKMLTQSQINAVSYLKQRAIEDQQKIERGICEVESKLSQVMIPHDVVFTLQTLVNRNGLTKEHIEKINDLIRRVSELPSERFDRPFI